MNDWQPINTAPRDGSTIIAYLPANAGRQPRQDLVAVFWDSKCGWATAYSGACVDAEPTYWMALPDAPIVGAQRVGKDDLRNADARS
jgi:hypothetical protein